MAAEPIVRVATTADAAALAELKIDWAGLDNRPSPAQAGEFAAALAEWMRAQGDAAVCVVAISADRFVGMAWMVLFERAPNVGDVHRLNADIQSVYVSPECRGAGIGEAMVQLLCDIAGGRGVRRITVSSSHRAVGLYRRLGFEDSPTLLERAVDGAAAVVPPAADERPHPAIARTGAPSRSPGRSHPYRSRPSA